MRIALVIGPPQSLFMLDFVGTIYTFLGKKGIALLPELKDLGTGRFNHLSKKLFPRLGLLTLY
jgi:hypothetical protein